MNIARKLAEQKASELLRAAAQMKGKAQRSMQDAAEKAVAVCDRMAFTMHTPARSQQIGIAMVDAVAAKSYPAHCAPLAKMVAARLATA